nr:hypothetical protein [uncultured Desulfuromonas sp.]
MSSLPSFYADDGVPPAVHEKAMDQQPRLLEESGKNQARSRLTHLSVFHSAGQ